MFNISPRLAGVVASLVLSGVIVAAGAAQAQDDPGEHIQFTQQDEVQSFDLVTGKGYQIGTATGMISGTTFVEFQFTPSGPPSGDALPITFQNKVIITDLDGDQLFFDNNGTGTFHLGIPGADFRGSGGPLVGTYVLTGATGKYQGLTVGSEYKHRAIFTSPPNGGLGNVYVEVSFRGKVGQR
jgi:hypothetical protein